MTNKLTKALGTIIFLTPEIMQLELLPDQWIPYEAGQYLQILCQQEWVSYSISNAPTKNGTYQLQIRFDAHNLCQQHLLLAIEQQLPLKIRLPFGENWVGKKSSVLPVVFIAGGTGFAPIKAQIEQQIIDNAQRSMTLFWLVRHSADNYCADLITCWQNTLVAFESHCLVSRRLFQQMLSDFVTTHPESSQLQFILAGPFDMVWFVTDGLLAMGIEKHQLYSDAFNFPRGGS